MIGRIIGQLAFLGFCLIASIALMELGSRFLFPEWAPVSSDRNFWHYDPLLGWSGRPEAQGRMEFIDFSVNVTLNSQGLRDTEYSEHRVPGTQRILLLGDSFGWGFGVEKEEIFAELIEARNENLEIINASVSGYGTDQEYLYFLHHGHRYGADVVVLLFFGGNDFANSASAVQYWHNKPLFDVSGEGLSLRGVPVPEMSWTQRIASYISGNTYFLRHVSSSVRAWRDRPKPSAASGTDEANPQPTSRQVSHETLRPDEERVVRLLLQLKQAVSENGARLIVAYIPGKRDIFKSPRLTATDIGFFSLAGIFRGAEDKKSFDHDPHWTPNGHRIVAEAVETYLRGAGILVSPEASDLPDSDSSVGSPSS